MTERLVDEGDLDPRYFGCCDNPGFEPLQCPACGHLMVNCYECGTVFPDLNRLDAAQREQDEATTPLRSCPNCHLDFGTEPHNALRSRVAWNDWTATWTGRRLVNCYPFPPAWLAGELPGTRSCDGTYCTYHYRSLPPIPASLLDETLSWLRRQPLAETYDSRWSSSQVAAQSAFDAQRSSLIEAARQAGYELPVAFLNFVFSRDALTRLRSPTDCYYSCDTQLVPCKMPMGGHFLRFLTDSQDCVSWHLYLHPQFGACVVFTEVPFEEWGDDDWPHAADRIRFCAETFLEFAARTWLEDELWFRLKEAQPLTPEMQQYLHHYTQGLDGLWSWDEEEW